MTADDLVLAVRKYLASDRDECCNHGPADRCYHLNDPYWGEMCDRCELRKAVDEYEAGR